MSPRARTACALLALCLASLAPRPAQAALDPAQADADARALLQSGDYAFCTDPERPLSGRAEALCPLASQVAGCEALAKACAEKEPPPIVWSPFWDKLGRWLGSVLPYIAWGGIVVLVLGVVYLVVRALRAAREDIAQGDDRDSTDVTLLPGEPESEAATEAETLLARAAQARARGDLRAALFIYLAAALRALDDRGAVRISRDRTHGEYVRSCRDSDARPVLRDLVREVDSVQFGGAAATPDAIAKAEGHAQRLVRPETTARVLAALTATALILSLGACTRLNPARHDPAGHDVLVDLLEKQHAKVTSLPGSLGNLPLGGKEGLAVIVDVVSVRLDHETSDHLAAWVKRGGTVVLAGSPSWWPEELWAKPLASASCDSKGPVTVQVETRDPSGATDDDDKKAPGVRPTPPAHERVAHLARRAAMAWPNEDKAPRAIARFEDGELYGALRTFGDGKVLGLASADLLTNLGLSVPGNAAALVAMLQALDAREFAVASTGQGILPPSNPLAGLLRIGLGPALVHAAFFLPILLLAYGTRQAAPRDTTPRPRRSFAEHVRAVGSLYARRRAASHALSVYARFVDGRLRSRMPRGGEPAQFLADRAGADLADTLRVYARAMRAQPGQPLVGDEIATIARLSLLYEAALSRK